MVVSLACAAEDQKTPIIDLRAPNSKSNAIVAFCSRESPRATGLPQHVFVAYGTIKEGKFEVSQALGMHKASAEGTTVGTVPRALVVESVSSLRAASCDLAVRVDPVHLLKLANLSERFESSNYVLTLNDCVTYAASVAEALNLDVPAREGLSNLPIQFVSRLTTINSTPEKLAEFARLRAAKTAIADKPKPKPKPKPKSTASVDPGMRPDTHDIHIERSRPEPRAPEPEPRAPEPEPRAPEPEPRAPEPREPTQVPTRH